MKRANTFEIVPQTENDKECLRRLLNASASLWNELTYERRQNDFGDGDVWDTSEYRGRYNGVVGSATVQQVTRKNSEAWRSFFALKENGEYANPPSYWGTEEDVTHSPSSSLIHVAQLRCDRHDGNSIQRTMTRLYLYIDGSARNPNHLYFSNINTK